ncbi:MAG TPA: ATP synthase subunit I [Polyangiales bacterium]
MNALATPRTTRLLLLIAVGFVASAFALWGAERGVAALVGASLSVLNWLALRWLTGRIVRSNAPGKGAASLLLVGKIGLLMAVVYILIARLRLDPVGLAFGLGVLFIGPVVVGIVGAGRASTSEQPLATGSNDTLRAAPTGPAAREER